MKIGIVPINLGEFSHPETLVPFVQEAEALGFESMWTFEHVIIPSQYESVYPYSPSGKLAFTADSEFIDPLVALTYIAAATEKLRLGTGINILPQVNPLYFAKQTACIDHLSNGRLMLGLGVGWLREEFDAIGVPFERRGKRADEYLEALKVAWTGEEVNFKGEFVDWHDFRILPPAKQKPGIPVFIGGVTPRAVKRVVEHGDGWYVIHNGPDQLNAHFKLLDAELAAQGRDKGTLEITSYWNFHKEGLDMLSHYEDLGVDRLLINVHALRQGDAVTALKWFADTVFPKLEARSA
ncbi:MAG: LLM class F420-dependent oxidoreductase [Gammaproteobacteria bacterium]|nr:LLM class F420-dependent oxidoreductase [Gammaproteobacteria bacterium]